ncbi:MAG: hypothetical protein HOL98_11800 [Gammaproteobacteria bacterium]|jgi:hypothetical protein|nr:hypothetical protein [Gammaproteobacteria bacterium]MBT5204129.1 hypothetical protein [Gammaproteobacteria bacterium]MBT6244659.1 hypothetical protein [Gammaproteobacteria bacterium]
MQLTLLYALLIFSLAAGAEERLFWSAGSYSKQDSAQREARRIANAINVDTQVQAAQTKAGILHRVLVRATRPDIKSALENIGIKGPWRVSVNDPATPSFGQLQQHAATEPQPGFDEVILPAAATYAKSNSTVLDSDLNPTSNTMGNTDNPANLAGNKESFFFSSADQDEPANKGRWRSDIGVELRAFQNPGMLNLEQNHASVSLQSEYYRTWNDGDDLFAFVPFLRFDAEDKERSHADIRELTWVHVTDSYELRTGIRKVFWGVTEAQHLVDIINQTDALENPDGEEKLGQPMINLSWQQNWGVLDIYWLMGFRERRFTGAYGRPAFPFQIESDEATYESSAEQYRSDFAIRWLHSIGDLELGVSHFSGTSREPLLVPRFTFNGGISTGAVLIPHYNIIEQTGLDAQYFLGDWAFKAEAISRSGQGRQYHAATIGFEKTFVGIAGSRGDLGLIAEYLYDARGPAGPALGQDDIAIGLRYAFNDAAATTALLVTLIDRESHEYLTTLEASSRIGERLKITVEGSIFGNTRRVIPGFQGFLEVFSDPHADLAFLQNEDFIKLELIWYL